MMKRRAIDLGRDYGKLLAMYRRSWEINFAGSQFREPAFKSWIGSGALQDEIYVYELDGELVGWLWLDVTLRRSAHIVHIQVEEDCWGQGLGRAIMEDAIALAVGAGRDVLTLAVTKSNARAMTLYRDLGFVVTEDDIERQRMKLDLVKD
jgi:ribosomal protein S18 acetylase RimI-like enzyme